MVTILLTLLLGTCADYVEQPPSRVSNVTYVGRPVTRASVWAWVSSSSFESACGRDKTSPQPNQTHHSASAAGIIYSESVFALPLQYLLTKSHPRRVHLDICPPYLNVHNKGLIKFPIYSSSRDYKGN